MEGYDTMESLERLEAYLKHHCPEVVNFTAKEICTLRKTPTKAVVVPPMNLWANMVPTLKLAQKIRNVIGPLSVGNGYRPADYNKAVGGSRRSTHITFRALDLDLGSSNRSREEQERFYELACQYWIREGDELKMGIGLYRPWRGTRIHIDTGSRKRYWKRKYVKPILDGMR